MSELMDDGIIRMPYEMAMSDELSRKQFYSRANSLLTELTEIRAKLAAMERRKPDMYRKEVHEGWPEWSENDLFSDGESGGEPWYRGSPVPADKPADKRVNRDDLRLDLDRRHLLNEAADRADYFFRQTDGSYKFPSLGGHVSQLIEMLLAAANLPADKPERITEQDAREIALSVLLSSGFVNGRDYIDPWLNREGRALLNKLNADREQVPAVAVPDGWKLVPIDPTGEMANAALNAEDESIRTMGHSVPFLDLWHAMLTAAPSINQQGAPLAPVPDEIHEYYKGDEPGADDYMQGWNDCRDAMLAAAQSHSQESAEPAVAVPDVANEEMISEGIKSLQIGLKIFGDNLTQIVSNIWEDMYQTAPSHSQQSAEVEAQGDDMGGEALSATKIHWDEFESWWEDHGQYIRAGGGQYEKTFAWKAWNWAIYQNNRKCDRCPSHESEQGGGNG